MGQGTLLGVFAQPEAPALHMLCQQPTCFKESPQSPVKLFLIVFPNKVPVVFGWLIGFVVVWVCLNGFFLLFVTH